MLTITPLRWATICRPNAWAQFQTPFTFTSITNRHSSAVTSSAGRWMQVPALLTSTSTWPSRSCISSTARSHLARLGDVGRRRPAALTPSASSSAIAVAVALAVADQQHDVAAGLGQRRGQGPADAAVARR